MKTTVEKITIAEALKRGYVHYGYDNGEKFQLLHNINLLHADDFERGKICPAENEGECAKIDNEEIKELIANHVHDRWVDDTGDDTESIYDLLMELDFEDVANRVNEKIESVRNYKILTHIEIVKSIN